MKRWYLSGFVLMLLLQTHPAQAALSYYAGTFTLTSGNGTQAVTGVGFQPKAIIAWWSKATADATFTAQQRFGFGIAVDATIDQQANITFYNEDNVATTDSERAKTLSSFIRGQNSVTPTYNVTATISSFDSDGFTITKSGNDGANLFIVKYVALGGTDITNAFLGEFTGPATGVTGDFGLTGVGFQGNLALFFGSMLGVSGDNQQTDYDFSIGAANGTQQSAMAINGNDGSASANQAESYGWNTHCLIIPNGSSLNINNLATFTSFDADGFTLNFDLVSTGARKFFALILKGTFQSHIGEQARKITTTGTQSITSPNFQPNGLLIVGAYHTAQDTDTTQAHLMLGAADGTRQQGMWSSDGAVINTDTNQYMSASNIYTQASNPNTVVAQAAFSSFTSTGYDLNWTTVDGNARRFFHLALASAPVINTRRPQLPLMFP